MNAFELYEKYLALKKHFTIKNYDYFKYHGKTRCSVQAFERRRDKHFFKMMLKYREPILMLIYNLVENDSWIGEICINEDALKIYYKHKKYNQSLTYSFKTEIAKFESLKQLISAEEGTHPLVLRAYIQGKISLETLVIIVDVARPIAYWRKKLPDDPILETIIFKVQKYKGFMNYDRNTMKEIIKDL